MSPEFEFLNNNGYNLNLATLQKRVSGFDPLQKARAKQLLNEKIKDSYEKSAKKTP